MVSLLFLSPETCRNLSEPGDLDNSGRKLILMSQLIDWLIGYTENVTGLTSWLIDWLIVLLIKINSKLWIDCLIEWLGVFCSIDDRLIDWLIEYTENVTGLTSWLIDWLIVLLKKINSKLWIDCLIEWLGVFCSIDDRLIDWLTALKHSHPRLHGLRTCFIHISSNVSAIVLQPDQTPEATPLLGNRPSFSTYPAYERRSWMIEKGNFFTFELLSVVGIPVIFCLFFRLIETFCFDLMIPDRGPVFLADKFGFFRLTLMKKDSSMFPFMMLFFHILFDDNFQKKLLVMPYCTRWVP